MSVVIGISGAWLEVFRKLQHLGLYVNTPDDIPPLLLRLREEFDPAVESKRLETESRISETRNKISALRTQKGFFRTILNGFRILGHYFNITRILFAKRLFIMRLSEQVKKLEILSTSHEIGGAKAELLVIDVLKKLPTDHVVINDVKLVSSSYIRFDGKPLKSAQIDHLVLSPAGVFVIETKCWSKSFVETGSYHNPFEQVRRASYLCYTMLKSRSGNIKVRSIIACVGHLPKTRTENYRVKVLRTDEINGYITWFNKEELASDYQNTLRHIFEFQSNK